MISNDKSKINTELQQIEQRLLQLRRDWVKGSPAMKKYIESGAKLYTDRKTFLEKKLKTAAQPQL